ncbi:MAG: NAD(P)H-hydrate epimerase, partial [Candidatus Nanohaloarchaea archaeon]
MSETERVSRDQMARIDEKVPEQYGITISRMMENAAYQVADFVRSEIDPEGIAVYAGVGNNGGDALAAARRLHLWGYDVEIVLASRELDGIRKEELEILENLGVRTSVGSPESDFQVALDGLIGYNIRGDPRPPFDELIDRINTHQTIISIDLPSGLEPDSGRRLDPLVDPDYTLTLAMPKAGMTEKNSGKMYLLDIGIPPEAYEEFGFTGDIFRSSGY